jgi:uncharacterized protein YegP (UPF0339 family)
MALRLRSSATVNRVFLLLAFAAATSVLACATTDAEPAPSGEQEVVAKAGKLQIFRGEDRQFYFRVVANNNEKLLRSQAYKTRGAAEKGLESTKANGKLPDKYRVAPAADGRFFFNLVAANGEVIGTSEPYASKENAERGVATLVKVFASLSADKAPRVVCSMKRLAAAGGEMQVDVDMTHVTENEPGISDPLEAFKGSYGFDATSDGRAISVIFTESNHIEDETGSTGCDIPKKLERGAVFCKEPLVIDANLGTDLDERKEVHAFDFFCHVD